MPKIGIWITLIAFLGLYACATVDHAEGTKKLTPQEQDVLRVVDEFFIAFDAGDMDTLRALTLQPGYVRAISTRNAPNIEISTTSFEDWYARFAENGDRLLEVYWEPNVQVRENLLASVWAPLKSSQMAIVFNVGSTT